MKEFRQLFNTMDLWLGRVYHGLGRAQQQLTKMYPHLESDAQKRIDALLVEIAQVREASLDQVEPLRILKKAPFFGFRGAIVSLIDFAYKLIVDPRAPSERQKHREAVQGLRRHFLNRSIDYISTAMGLPPEGVRTMVIQLMKDLGLIQQRDHQVVREQLEAVASTIFPTAGSRFISPREASQLLSDIAKSKDMFEKLKQELESRIKKLNALATKHKIADEDIDTAIGMLQYIEQVPQEIPTTKTSELRIRAADATKMHEIVADLYKKVVESRNQSEKFLSLAAQARNINSQKAKKQDLDLVMRYYSYVQALFGPVAAQSITRLLDQLAKDLKELQILLAKRSGIDSPKDRGSTTPPSDIPTEITPLESKDDLNTEKTAALQAYKNKIMSLLKDRGGSNDR